MKRPVTYLASVILTLLLIFMLLASMGAGVVQFFSLDTKTALSIVQTQKLAERVHTSLESDFRQRESTTGIPAELFTDAISAEALEPIIRDTVTNGFSYLRGETASLGVSPDFSGLEEKVRQFCADYAAEQHLEQDESYEKAVRTTITESEAIILSGCDVFRFGSLNDAGVFQTAKRFIPWVGAAVAALIAMSLILAVCLFAVNRHAAEHGCYWCGTALLIASLLLLIPSAWLHFSRWFDRFAVKTDQTFAAVTGFLYANTRALMITAAAEILTAVLLYVIFALLHAHRQKREIVRKSKH